MLKRIILFCAIAFAFNAKAQFTIDDDTLYAYGFAGTSSSSFVDLYAHSVIRHTSMSNETIKWVRTTNSLQDTNWTSAVCDIVSCRGPEVDTGSFQISNMDTGELSFHFYPEDVNGTGTMVVRFYRESNPTEYHDVVILCTAWKPVSIRMIEGLSTAIYPIPASKNIIVTNSLIKEGRYEVLNSLGQVISKGTYADGMNIDIDALESGVYSLMVTDGINGAVKQFIKE